MSRTHVRDVDIVEFLQDYFHQHTAFPKLEEICRKFGWSSLNAAHERIRSLRKKGLVRENSLAPASLPCPHCNKNLCHSG